MDLLQKIENPRKFSMTGAFIVPFDDASKFGRNRYELRETYKRLKNRSISERIFIPSKNRKELDRLIAIGDEMFCCN